jgi:hypothetical protein
MKGPALWLKSYQRCREVMTHGCWVSLLALAAAHGEWVRMQKLSSLPGVKGQDREHSALAKEMRDLERAGLAVVRHLPSSRMGYPAKEARITTRGLHLLGWPELTVMEEETTPAK